MDYANQTYLCDQVKMWPTPNVCGGGNPPELLRKKGNHYVRQSGVKAHLSLDQAVMMFATPKNRDWKGQSKRGVHAPMDALPNLDSGDGTVVGGRLNPDWTEILMGWPSGWTSLVEPVGRDAFESWIGLDFAGGWRDGTWEAGVPRVLAVSKQCKQRLMCIGNGQVPQTAAMAWSMLFERIGR